MPVTPLPKYVRSHALVIGVNRYLHAPPLGFAVNDAQAVAASLVANFGFAKEDVALLLDSDATLANITKKYMAFAEAGTELNDRLLFFFAGHGETISAPRGDVGYLVPVDGNRSDLSTLLRWDTITRDADLIAAKHILFVMDACYGGLAVKRSLKPGSMRFLKDMLQRPCRQVLTAGKADEVVADANGPRPSHSVFTGHFLNALDGEAASDGILTANGVMGYVYNMVGNDPNSEQTPHYGYISGDGDFVFNPPAQSDIDSDETKEQDKLIGIPSSSVLTGIPAENVIELAKSYLARPDDRIRLRELVVAQTRTLVNSLSVDQFSAQGRWSPEEFADRLQAYDQSLSVMSALEMLLGYWGDHSHFEAIAIPPKRLAEMANVGSGLRMWIYLRWYPIVRLAYCCAIGSIVSGKTQNLLTLLHARIPDRHQSGATRTLVDAMFESFPSLGDAFKTLPGHERQYVPASEYLFKSLQPLSDDTLYTGGDYEALFDRVEIALALECATQTEGWGPIGRFGWKHKSRRGEGSPFDAFVEEAESHGNGWQWFKAGFFGGNLERFRKTCGEFKNMLDQLPWF